MRSHGPGTDRRGCPYGSGARGVLYYALGIVQNAVGMAIFARKWIGLFPTDVFLVRAPYALPLTGHLAHAAGRLKGALINCSA